VEGEASLSFNVTKHTERFIYSPTVASSAIPIAYIENPPLDSFRDLHITEMTHLVRDNSALLAANSRPYDIVIGSSYTSAYRDILATNVTVTDEGGNLKPLFYRHRLPSDTVSVSLYVIQNGNKQDVDTGYLLDISQAAVYTNYKNFYDEVTHSYRVHFLIITRETGEVQHEILNVETAAREATWQDLDLDTGDLIESLPVFSKESTAGGSNYTFASVGPWYIRPLDTSLIQVQRPTGKTAKDYWYLKVTNGEFGANVNGAYRRYYIPEFDTQLFAPYKPLLYSQVESVLRVNSRILKITRNNLYVEPDSGLHLMLTVRDPNGVLVAAWTTDQALHGTTYIGNVKYDSTVIQCTDNATGFISVGLDILGSWQIAASYYYSAIDLEYTAINFNPTWNPKAKEYTYVLYLIPDVSGMDMALQHIGIDRAGIIVEASQAAGINYPNLQLFNSDGTYNENTVIGMPYAAVGGNSFLGLYAASMENSNAYMIMCTAVVSDLATVEQQQVIDVRRKGDTLVEATKQAAFLANPRTLQSVYGYGEDGQTVPKNGVMIVDIPLSVLTDYGGNFSEAEVVTLLNRNKPAATILAPNWITPKGEMHIFNFADYLNDIITGLVDSGLTGTDYENALNALIGDYFTESFLTKLNINIVWSGMYRYNLYHKLAKNPDWELLEFWDGLTFASAANDMHFLYSPTEEGIHQFELRLSKGSVEYPASVARDVYVFAMNMGG
jgi:hypothetical protein